MSINNNPAALRALIQRQLQDNKLTSTEADELLTEINKDGITPEEAQALVDSLTGAASNAWRTSAGPADG